MFVIKNKNIFFTLSSILVVLSLGAIIVWGLNFSIDFTGGSLTEVRYSGEVPTRDILLERVKQADFVDATVRETGGSGEGISSGYIINTRDLTDIERQELLGILSVDGAELEVERFSSIGPSIGAELRSKAYVAIVIVVLAIILFVAFVFRHVSKPVSSWKYGLIAIIALLHDIIIPTGVFAVLGHFLGFQVDILFVMALLAILGFSVNDTIVVFDRIRENLARLKEKKMMKPFDQVVGESLAQTYVRSINTSLTTLAVLLTLFFVGGEVTRGFVLTLIVGVIAGTYSSIFLASPLLVVWGAKQKKK